MFLYIRSSDLIYLELEPFYQPPPITPTQFKFNLIQKHPHRYTQNNVSLATWALHVPTIQTQETNHHNPYNKIK